MTDKELIERCEKLLTKMGSQATEQANFTKLLTRFRHLTESKPSVDEIVEAIKPLMSHEPLCNINGRWNEADAAMSDTPEEFRDANWYASIEEINIKRTICTCKHIRLRTAIESVVNKTNTNS